MSILIIQGPGPASTRLDAHVAADLWRTAWRLNHELRFEACADIDALASRLRGPSAAASDFVMLEPGSLSSSSASSREALRAALEALRAPLVEVCARSGDALDFQLSARRQPVATIIIDGDPRSRFRVALCVALRRLAGL